MKKVEPEIKIPSMKKCTKYNDFCKFNGCEIDNGKNVLKTKWINDGGCMCTDETKIDFIDSFTGRSI